MTGRWQRNARSRQSSKLQKGKEEFRGDWKFLIAEAETEAGTEAEAIMIEKAEVIERARADLTHSQS